MGKWKVVDNKTGKSYILEGDTPPSERDIESSLAPYRGSVLKEAGKFALSETARALKQMGGFESVKALGEAYERPIAGLRGVAKEGAPGFMKGMREPEKYPVGTFGEELVEAGLDPTLAGALGTTADVGYYFGVPMLARGAKGATAKALKPYLMKEAAPSAGGGKYARFPSGIGRGVTEFLYPGEVVGPSAEKAAATAAAKEALFAGRTRIGGEPTAPMRTTPPEPKLLPSPKPIEVKPPKVISLPAVEPTGRMVYDPLTNAISQQAIIAPTTNEGVALVQAGLSKAKLPSTLQALAEPVSKVVSKYPIKITNQSSLTQFGDAVAKEMGITQPIKWRWKPSKSATGLGVSGKHRAPIRGVVGREHSTITISPAPERGIATRGVVISPTQGNIKRVVVHELVHALPEMMAKRVRGVMHPKGFYDRLAEERVMRLFDIKEVAKEKSFVRSGYQVEYTDLNGKLQKDVQAGSTIISNLANGHKYTSIAGYDVGKWQPPTPRKEVAMLPSPEPLLMLPRGTVSSYFQMEKLPELAIPHRVEYIQRALRHEAKTFLGAEARESIVRRAGEPGDVLIYELKNATTLPFLRSGQYNAELMQVASRHLPFTEGEVSNLQDALEGRAKPMNIKVGEMFDVMHRQRKTIESLRRSQDPTFIGLRHYYHHEIPPLRDLKNPTMRESIARDMVRRGEVTNTQEAKVMIDEWVAKVETERTPTYIQNYLVRTGQARDKGEASYLLNQYLKRYRGFKYGAFEPRTLDLPFYNPNPLQVVPRYNEEALRMLYNSERFGEHAQKLWQLFDKIGESGATQETARTLIDLFLGTATESDTKYLTRMLLDVQVVEKMSLSAIGNYFQGLTGSALRTNLGASVRAIREVKKDLQGAINWAAKAGQHPEFKFLFSEGAGGIARKFLKMVRFTKTEVNNYVQGIMTGKIYAIDQFALLEKNPHHKLAIHNLKKMGINPGLALDRGYLTDDEMLIAGITVWREGQAIPTIFNQPQKWLGMSLTTDRGRLAWQFKSVAYNQGRLVWESTVKKLKRGDWGGFISSLATLLLLFPAVGEVIEGVQDTLSGRKRPEGFWPRYLDDLQGAFAFGILDDLYYMTAYGQILGPTFQQATEIGKALHNPKLFKQQLRNIPFIGRMLYEASKEKKSRSSRPPLPTKPARPRR